MTYKELKEKLDNLGTIDDTIIYVKGFDHIKINKNKQIEIENKTKYLISNHVYYSKEKSGIVIECL